jgi:hypothetical protein
MFIIPRYFLVAIRAASLAWYLPGYQARSNFEILAWPDPSIKYLTWPASQARLKMLTWVHYNTNFFSSQIQT